LLSLLRFWFVEMINKHEFPFVNQILKLKSVFVMKKLILSTLFLCLVAVVMGSKSFAASPLPAKSINLKTANFKNLFLKENDVAASKSEQKKVWKCFSVVIYTICGTAWDGDVCVETDLPYLLSSQFHAAATLKDYQHCGYTY
jgi:hypothetical protein